MDLAWKVKHLRVLYLYFSPVFRKVTQDFAYILFMSPNSSAVQNGMWEDADSNGRPDAGEFVSCDITVANKGTVTLHIIEVMDTSGGTSCTTPDSGLLAQGESYVCTTLRKVHIHIVSWQFRKKLNALADCVRCQMAWTQVLNALVDRVRCQMAWTCHGVAGIFHSTVSRDVLRWRPE